MVEIRRMHIKDVSFVYDLEKTTFGFSLEKSMLYDEILYNEMAHYYIMTEHQQRIGYLGLWLTNPNAEIINIALVPEKQSQGYGKKLLEYAIKVCEENKVKTLTLEVRKSLTHLIEFYQSFGFKKIHERKRYYHDHEDAWLMAKEVNV